MRRFRRYLALLALDARPRAAAVRLGLVLVAIASVGIAVRGTVALMLLREEARATRRYVRTLERNNVNRENTLREAIGQRDHLAAQSTLSRVALQVGSMAAKRGRWLSDRQALEIADAIIRSAGSHDVPVKVVLGVIMTESGFDARAVSSKGAIGLMQLMPRTAEGLSKELGMDIDGPADLRDPRVNIELGTYYLSSLIRRHGNVPRALTSYNMGPGHRGPPAKAFIAEVARHAGGEI